MNKSLEFYSNLAYTILNSNTQYILNKRIISSIYRDVSISDHESIIKYRLTVIDSYYSTQMSKRLYGIDEIAKEIAKYSDKELKEQTILFLNSPSRNSSIKFILSKEYGIDKSGKSFGKSKSLISKYLYFLNEGNFPIYDSLGKDSYRLLDKNKFITTNKAISEDNYFDCLKKLNTDSGINDYAKLDNLLWLIGKLYKGSFSILMTKEMYLNIVEDISDKLINIKSKQKDEEIRQHIKSIYLDTDMFNDDQKDFFDFVFNL